MGAETPGNPALGLDFSGGRAGRPREERAVSPRNVYILLDNSKNRFVLVFPFEIQVFVRESIVYSPGPCLVIRNSHKGIKNPFFVHWNKKKKFIM